MKYLINQQKQKYDGHAKVTKPAWWYSLNLTKAQFAEKFILKYIYPKTDIKILDIGCQTGATLSMIKTDNFGLFGID